VRDAIDPDRALRELLFNVHQESVFDDGHI
jgi:hypothetical protein